ncbi:MAG: FAD-dependent monooxygenase [Actinomycetota bacterium]|nr:FAD-dependent monooxygenase [Actinomycetota bacterium]
MTYDVAIVGASIGGCTAAKLFGERGARVALIEKRPDPDAYKTVCTHYIQPSATPVIERLGLAPALEERGAVHNSIDMWTPYSGWIRSPEDDPYGYNVTRQTLDPLLRAATAETPGVELLCGKTVAGLSPDGVELRDGQRITAKLVVGADGRGSNVAKWAGIRGRVKPHNRFFYWAYWRGVEPATDRSRMWFLEPDCAYTFPNEDGLTIVLVGPHRDRLPEFKADLEGAYMRFVERLPEPPRLDNATRESKLLGKLDVPNVMRPAARGRVALVGDAALASDPLWGVGCGWAFQSAEWLVDETADALVSGGDLDAALERYRKVHFRRLAPHHWMIADLASGRPANPFERMLFKSAARDPAVVKEFAKVGSRREPPTTILRPRTLARMVRAGV